MNSASSIVSQRKTSRFVSSTLIQAPIITGRFTLSETKIKACANLAARNRTEYDAVHNHETIFSHRTVSRAARIGMFCAAESLGRWIGGLSRASGVQSAGHHLCGFRLFKRTG